MQAMEAAKELAKAIQETPEYREYSALKKEIDADAGIKALIQEYRRLQTSMQMRMLSGQGMDADETQRFNSLNMLFIRRQPHFRLPHGGNENAAHDGRNLRHHHPGVRAGYSHAGMKK